MNPVDHVRQCTAPFLRALANNLSYSLTVVEITSILVKHPRSPVTPHKVRRPVSSQLGELVCYAVPRRQRIRRTDDRGVLGWLGHVVQLHAWEQVDFL